jgi:hypothetical protein
MVEVLNVPIKAAAFLRQEENAICFSHYADTGFVQ